MVHWNDNMREPRQPPDPNYPDGIDIDNSRNQTSCQAQLPYPAKRCGYYAVKCYKCGITAIVSTAGRRDDPRSVRLPCKTKPAAVR